jgi:LPXTG-site transpeptidase (sortase) family protein
MNLARVNNILTIAIVAINLFIFCMPFIPATVFWAKQSFSDNILQLQKKVESSEVPNTNRLIVPSIMLDEEIHPGADESTLSKGLWLEPTGALPGNGETVISGHRFTYNDPEGAFYNLDKVKTGDKIAVYWEKQKILYSVTNKYVVGADYKLQTDDSNSLILYTCTPLWNPTERLIVEAEPPTTGGTI